MLAERPPLLDLIGLTEEEAYSKARSEFEQLLMAAEIVDPLGRRIVFVFGDNPGADDDCFHVCYKQNSNARDPYSRQPRERFRDDRAARIPWIRVALEHVETRIRESPVSHDPGRQSYTLWVPAAPKLQLPQESYGVFVRPTNRPDEMAFVTAFTMDPATAERVKKAGRQLYPAKPAKKSK